ncbi:C2H2 finger domain-containing protein [Histoplasma capsulatum H143]|uniref:C2H2 finger domain-containing protein n=1 Tax=Ajellomyces capsulatus (strain H143) TaxID=544712 RepID=C6HN42_AJECH|nr:C2H2 finger domain-containing protein [Histoplasma capsulatum H143]
MSTKTITSPPRVSITKRSYKIKAPYVPKLSTGQDCSQPSSAMAHDEEFHSQDAFSFSPLCGSSSLPDNSQWPYLSSNSSTTSDATDESFETGSMPVTEPDITNSQEFTFTSYSHPVISGHISSLDHPTSYSSLSDVHDLSDATDSGNSPHLAFSSSQGYQPSLSSVFCFTFDNASSQPNDSHGCDLEDTKQMRLESQDIARSEMFGDARSYDHMSMDTDGFSLGGANQVPDIFHHGPITPPLTEGSSDASVSSSCSQDSYAPFSGHDDPMFTDIPTSVSPQPFNLRDPLCRFTTQEQDFNRPSKHTQRPLLSAAEPQKRKEDQKIYSHYIGQNPSFKDAQETRNPRDHDYYSPATQADGKYHCPFENDEKPCSHPPTTQKCGYHKYLDSHLKPYRCKVSQCVDAHFSSNACLFRHEREAHGMHGHGENPHLCHFSTCERSVPGNGFPRRWNLHDHMKRVHDYSSSERVSSPEQSPVDGQQPKKKDSTVRRRKGAKATTMKRVRSSPTQSSSLTKAAQTQAQQGHQLQNAERNYYNCLARLQEDLNNINPQDPGLHDKANASLQELHTLALNYRCIRASQAANERSPGYSR